MLTYEIPINISIFEELELIRQPLFVPFIYLEFLSTNVSLNNLS